MTAPALQSRLDLLYDLGFEVVANGDALGDERIPVFTPLRNEIMLLPVYLAHYAQRPDLRLVLIDNDSTDGTLEYLRDCPDAVVLRTSRSYRDSHFAVDWVNELVSRFYPDRWVIHVDCDELLVLPAEIESRFSVWLDELEATGRDCVFTPMIDMYPDGSILHTEVASAGDFKRLRFFDTAYRFLPWPRRPWDPPAGNSILVAGGPLWRLLGLDPDKPPGSAHNTAVNIGARFGAELPVPLMLALARMMPAAVPARHKMAINHAGRGFRWYNSHVTSNANFAEVNGALLHLKFCSNIARRIALSMATRQHYMGGLTDCQMATALQRWGERSLVTAKSAEFSGPDDLQRHGLIGDRALAVWRGLVSSRAA